MTTTSQALIILVVPCGVVAALLLGFLSALRGLRTEDRIRLFEVFATTLLRQGRQAGGPAARGVAGPSRRAVRR
jgi:hypothetical protein